MEQLNIKNNCQYTLILLTGIMWPLQSLPTWVRQISYSLPVTISCEAARSILMRGKDEGHQC